MAYTDLAACKVLLNIATGTTGDDALLSTLITRSQKQIESCCKRGFETTTSGNTYYYRPDSIFVLPNQTQYRIPGTNYIGAGAYSWDTWPSQYYGSGQYGNTVLYLDKDILSVTSLTNGDSTGTTITSTEYWLEPRNSTTCFQVIRLKSNVSWQFGTDGEVAVAGQWGFSTAAPADVVHATERLVAFHYRKRDVSEYDVTSVSELGTITVPSGLPEDVRRILEDGGYVRRQFVR
ncbi:MAG: hypothetical protein Q7K03_08370 [Dehalococcoidia bacterium]|nr:hypothetical protein [Dehalococcoidia bacterium]